MPEHPIPMERITVDALYDERGEVSWTRPVLQGDVFHDIELPGWDSPQTVQIVAHPCAMRRGPVLVERVTVAPVVRHKNVADEEWDGHLKFMPLADLHEDAKDYAAQFQNITAAPSELLDLDNRIATLSNRGIFVLQQRLIKHLTRLTVDIPTLRMQAGPVLEEAEQERDWLETMLGAETRDMTAVQAESKAFDDWLSGGDPSRRSRLQMDANHLDVRRESRAAAAKRKAERSE